MLLCLLSLIGDPPVKTPALAEVFGIRVGRNGQKRLEHKFGLGTRSVGGHPHGTESWNMEFPPSAVTTDGFKYTQSEGERIEDFTWETQSAAFADVHVVIRPSQGWLGRIVLGMPKRQALKIAQHILGPGKKHGDVVTWIEHGRDPAHRTKDGGTLRNTWRASLGFTNEKVSSVQIRFDSE